MADERKLFTTTGCTCRTPVRDTKCGRHVIDNGADWTCSTTAGDFNLGCTCGSRTFGINFCPFTEMSMNCSLVNLHVFFWTAWTTGTCATRILNLLNFCSIGHLVHFPGCSRTVPLRLHLDYFGLHSRLARSPVTFVTKNLWGGGGRRNCPHHRWSRSSAGLP